MKTGVAEIVTGLYEGQPYNAPNDISIDEKGHIYFSDPRYLGLEPVVQATMAVYRIDPDGAVHRIITDAGKPNGVAVSPDQKMLYVVSSDNGALDFQRLRENEKTTKGRMDSGAALPQRQGRRVPSCQDLSAGHCSVLLLRIRH